MKKILLIVICGFVVLAIASVVLGAIFIGPIIKSGVETYGPKVTQVPIKLDGVVVSLFNGSAQVKGLVVGNPSGFKSPEAIKLGLASVKLEPMSVFHPKIIVHSIKVESPEITFEGGVSGNNLSKILANVDSVAKTSGGAAPSSTGTPGANQPGKPAPKLQIDDFLITGAKVHVNVGAGGVGQKLDLTLPDIHLTGLGQGSDGITPAELIQTVMTQITTTTMQAVTKSVADVNMKGLGKDAEKQVGEGINKVMDGILGK
jgi:uncharacterized protein involved in outer membrane biogenesis